MNTQKTLGAALLAVGLMMTGCGGTEADMPLTEGEGAVQSLPEQTDHAQAATVWCTDQAWKVAFYSDASLTTQVGYLQCPCYQPQIQSGTVTNYQKLIYNRYCSLD